MLEELKKEVKELKKELYNFKDMQKSITAMELTTEEKKELHSLNSKVKFSSQGSTVFKPWSIKAKQNCQFLIPIFLYKAANLTALLLLLS
mgnify:CR=1 FL=1